MAEVIHHINGKSYLYEHHREGDKVVSTYLHPVDDVGSTRPTKYKERITQQEQKNEIRREMEETKYKNISDEQFNNDKVSLANSIIKTEKQSSYQVVGKGKNGEIYVIADNIDNYNDASNIASKNYPYPTDDLKTKYGHIDKGEIIILQNHKPDKISNKKEVDEILNTKDKKRFYEAIKPKYTPKKPQWQTNFNKLITKNEPKIKADMKNTKPFSTSKLNDGDIKLGDILFETKEYKLKDGKKEKRFYPVVVTGFRNYKTNKHTDLNNINISYSKGDSVYVTDYYNTDVPTNAYDTGRALNNKNVRI